MTRPTIDARFAIRNNTWKRPVRVATTGNVTISTALNNGDTIDGISLVTGDRVLVKSQSTGSQNGIYVVGTSPARAVDFADETSVVGAVVVVSEGTANADTTWLCTNDVPTVVGTDTITFVALSSGSSSSLTVAEIDTAPTVTNVTEILVTNGT